MCFYFFIIGEFHSERVSGSIYMSILKNNHVLLCMFSSLAGHFAET